MLFWLPYIPILIAIGPILGEISVNRVILRIPKDGDIGLIFDINLVNTANEEKQLLEYRIRPRRECCVNLTEHSMTANAGKIIGGSFGNIEPGAIKTISVIWPTTAIFNRVGYCDIIITSTNVKNEEKEFTQQLDFDTRFAKIDATGTTFRRRKEYVECSNWDMDFLNNCTPVNCEEKYLGRRNFYNRKTKMCDSVPKCIEKHQVYDIYANECTDLSNLMNTEDMEAIKRGKYENNSLELSGCLSESEQVRNARQELVPVLSHKKKQATFDFGILNNLSIIIATIVIYSTMCFFIFLVVNWLSRISARPRSPIVIKKI